MKGRRIVQPQVGPEPVQDTRSGARGFRWHIFDGLELKERWTEKEGVPLHMYQGGWDSCHRRSSNEIARSNQFFLFIKYHIRL